MCGTPSCTTLSSVTALLTSDISEGETKHAFALAYPRERLEIHTVCPVLERHRTTGLRSWQGPHWWYCLHFPTPEEIAADAPRRGEVWPEAGPRRPQRACSFSPPHSQPSTGDRICGPWRRFMPFPPMPSGPNRCGEKANACFVSSAKTAEFTSSENVCTWR